MAADVGSCGACRADRAEVAPPWAVPVMVPLFLVGFWLTAWYVDGLDVADRFDDVRSRFDMWVALVGAVGGFALAAGLWFALAVQRLAGLFAAATVRMVITWVGSVMLVGVAVLGSLFVGAGETDGTVDSQLASGTRPITVAVAVCLAPGLVLFLALRSLALDARAWDEPRPCQLRLVLRCRRELRRTLAVLGSFLTLLVVATGIRRRAVIAAEPAVDLPAEAVLLYGLVFAVQLGLFYVVASSAIDRRSDRVVDTYAPIPDPTSPSAAADLGRRTALVALLGGGSSWSSFQSSVIIAAPLVTALIGTATG